jgi:hypothetical protein
MFKEYTKNMDEQDPLNDSPVQHHPNAVKSIPVEFDSEPEPPKKMKFEPVAPDYHKSKSKKGLWIIAILLGLLLAGAAYWFLLKPKPASVPAKTSPSASTQSATSQISTETEHYDSANFDLSFDHPKGWTVKDDPAALSVVSGAVKLKLANGQQQDGQVLMLITKNNQKLYGLDKDASTAILDSEKITYSKPSETQRGNTFISFLNYSISTDKGLDAIYITGDNGYKQNQAVPKGDIEKSDPIISVTFNKCANKGCAELGTPTTIDESMWAAVSFSKPIKTMLESLAIQ